jgi:hypothetical protein
MASHGSHTQGDGRLLAALLQGEPVASAAKQAGLSERTAYRRLQEPAFQRALAQGRTRALACAVMRLVDGSARAAGTLCELASTARQDGVRLMAARSVLDYALKGAELLDLVARIEALEAAAARPGIGPQNGRTHAYAP